MRMEPHMRTAQFATPQTASLNLQRRLPFEKYRSSRRVLSFTSRYLDRNRLSAFPSTIGLRLSRLLFRKQG
jgi:hypothetical protein